MSCGQKVPMPLPHRQTWLRTPFPVPPAPKVSLQPASAVHESEAKTKPVCRIGRCPRAVHRADVYIPRSGRAHDLKTDAFESRNLYAPEILIVRGGNLDMTKKIASVCITDAGRGIFRSKRAIGAEE